MLNNVCNSLNISFFNVKFHAYFINFFSCGSESFKILNNIPQTSSNSTLRHLLYKNIL